MDSRIKKKIYKIRNKQTGLYSNGGKKPKFSVNGKIWTQKNHLLLHLKIVDDIDKIYKNCEIVVLEMVETEVKKINDQKRRKKDVYNWFKRYIK